MINGSPFIFPMYLPNLLPISFHGITALEYRVINIAAATPGGIRFNNKIGHPFTKKIMGTINNYIWSVVFQQNDPADQKQVDSVNTYIVEFDGAAGIAWGNNNINVITIYIKDLVGDLKWQFTSLMLHEMTHVFQWNGEGTTPSGLIEGIADYTVLRANHMQWGFANPGDGDRWDQGYAVTSRFLEYCDGIIPFFVAKLNKLMRVTYDVKYFEDLTGKPVDQLWHEYKAKYGH
ncbi:hypothetical protein L6452_20991 [Arctium lappa]|uniref:Uncharacterized protein n=1 Tax=Arctium lappa TaxID=4217 RepID=A0ACB9BCW5_ARCLA|nr:hypothetical protein L6452_20991 [Arctium lappa]